MLTPITLRELDNLKRASNKNEKVRKVAQNLIRRLVDYGNRGNIADGVQIGERMILMTRASEPPYEGHLEWLDLNVPDDRFIASALEVYWDHPKARVLVTSGDFNVINKARTARLATLYAPGFFRGIEPIV